MVDIKLREITLMERHLLIKFNLLFFGISIEDIKQFNDLGQIDEDEENIKEQIICFKKRKFLKDFTVHYQKKK
jgi:hypothetical protein